MNNINFENIDYISQINLEHLSYPNSIFFLNIRSLRTNFNNLLALIHGIINHIEIIVLVETNLNDDETPFYGINGFNSVFICRQGKGGGGVAVYIKENIIFTKISVETKSFESIHINIQNNESFSLFAIYRPPSPTVSNFIKELDTLINTVNKHKNAIVVGDMNIDLLTENQFKTHYLDMLASNGMQCIINECTREDINRNS